MPSKVRTSVAHLAPFGPMRSGAARHPATPPCRSKSSPAPPYGCAARFSSERTGRCDTRDFRDKVMNVCDGGLRHSLQLRHGRGLCRGCRGSRRGVPRDFRKLGMCVKSHHHRPARLPMLQPERPPAPRFRGPSAPAIHAFQGCPEQPEPSGFPAARSAQAAPHPEP